MHTKGPWEVSEESGLVDGCACIEASEGVVAHVELWEYEDEETKEAARANAALIASAPDLLQALKDLQKRMKEIHGKWNVKKDYSLMVADVAASKAIDKAEGRS